MAVRDPLVAAVHGDQLSPSAARTEHPAEAAAFARAEEVLGHRFRRPELLREALTHRSAAYAPQARGRNRGQGGDSNERLEFVGDRVLGLLIAEWISARFPREQEGELGRRLAHLVSQPVLAEIGDVAGMSDLLSVAPGEARAGVRRRATVLADAMEAVIGALYLDGGIEAARRFVRQAWEPAMNGQLEPPKDAKTALQEWSQQRALDLPDYVVARRDGPPHAPVFVIEVTIDGRTGTGTAGTKRAAEQAAAVDLLAKLSA